MSALDLNLIRSVITVLAMAAFLGIVWWAWSAARIRRFEEAARLPFDGEDR
jgi:cytochrome c oxidase cbb3-type subunit 4